MARCEHTCRHREARKIQLEYAHMGGGKLEVTAANFSQLITIEE
jgi:hypothetical protein